MLRSILFILVLVLLSCKQELIGHRISGAIFGTTYNILYFSSSKKSELKTEVDRLLFDLDHTYSTYKKNSELSKLNRAKELNVSPKLWNLLKEAKEINRLSNGAFDISVGPLVNLWGFGPKRFEKPPRKELLDETLSLVGPSVFDLSGMTLVNKIHPKVYLDLSAMAKGDAVDEVAKLLAQKGIENFLVEIGGEIRARGNKPTGEFIIGIETPDKLSGIGRSKIFKKLPLRNMSMATSGNYRNFKSFEGQEFAHTIDPRTGRPAMHTMASASVFHPSCALADAWATAFMVHGVDASLRLANNLSLSAFFLVKEKGKGNFKAVMSDQFKKDFAAYLEE